MTSFHRPGNACFVLGALACLACVEPGRTCDFEFSPAIQCPAGMIQERLPTG